ncbi:MAG: cupredoxin domain-containing protein [Candidatus Doudnabacteria bacterium]|nr:cupredoxin domain-containing protein [Candidatus Doudnabacteria bacterium]
MKFKLLLVLAVLVFGAAACNKKTENPAASLPPIKATPTEVAQQEVIVSENGFSPSEITIKKGSVVTFINKSSKAVWPASDPHPTHTDYSGFDPKKAVESGASWSFTFDQIGEWGYHDHLSPFRKGTIKVTD